MTLNGVNWDATTAALALAPCRRSASAARWRRKV